MDVKIPSVAQEGMGSAAGSLQMANLPRIRRNFSCLLKLGLTLFDQFVFAQNRVHFRVPGWVVASLHGYAGSNQNPRNLGVV